MENAIDRIKKSKTEVDSFVNLLKSQYSYFDTDLSRYAMAFAEYAHGINDQKRKYTDDSYHTHLKEVGLILQQFGSSEEEVVAGILHDIIEDTLFTEKSIKEKFNSKISSLVVENTSPRIGKNRKERHQNNLIYFSGISLSAKKIRMADMISNLKDIKDKDPKFARIYIPEKRELLELFKDADSNLYRRVLEIINE